MSRTFGEIRQIAFVVSDIDAAMRYWANTLGIGPFFIKRRITLAGFCSVKRNGFKPGLAVSSLPVGAPHLETSESSRQSKMNDPELQPLQIVAPPPLMYIA